MPSAGLGGIFSATFQFHTEVSRVTSPLYPVLTLTLSPQHSVPPSSTPSPQIILMQISETACHL